MMIINHSHGARVISLGEHYLVINGDDSYVISPKDEKKIPAAALPAVRGSASGTFYNLLQRGNLIHVQKNETVHTFKIADVVTEVYQMTGSITNSGHIIRRDKKTVTIFDLDTGAELLKTELAENGKCGFSTANFYRQRDTRAEHGLPGAGYLLVEHGKNAALHNIRDRTVIDLEGYYSTAKYSDSDDFIIECATKTVVVTRKNRRDPMIAPRYEVNMAETGVTLKYRADDGAVYTGSIRPEGANHPLVSTVRELYDAIDAAIFCKNGMTIGTTVSYDDAVAKISFNHPLVKYNILVMLCRM